MIYKIFKYFTVLTVTSWIVFTILRIVINVYPGYGYLFLYFFVPVSIILFIISVINSVIKKNYKELINTVIILLIVIIFLIAYTLLSRYLFLKL